MLIRKIVLLSGMIALAVHGTAYSANESDEDEIGAFQFLPSLGISGTRDDNFFSQPNNVDRDTIIRYQPKFKFYGREGHNSYSLAYDGDFGDHSINSHDDYDDHALTLDLKTDGSMNDLDVLATYAKLHEKRGEGLSEGPAALFRSRYDQYDLTRIAGIWEIGADSPVGFQVMGDRSTIEYRNNLWLTEYRSREEDGYTARFYVRAGSTGAKVFFEYGRKNIIHDIDIVPGITFDNKEDSYVVGMEWYITDTTTGVIKGGKTEKDFEYVAVGLEEFELDSWEAELTWSPVPYSVGTVSSVRRINETNGTGSFIVARDNDLKWKHNFSDSMSISLSASQGKDFFQNDLRVDDRSERGVLFEYDMESKLTIGIGYHYKKLNSSNDLFDYDREIYYLEFTLH